MVSGGHCLPSRACVGPAHRTAGDARANGNSAAAMILVPKYIIEHQDSLSRMKGCVVTLKTVTMSVIVASGLSMFGAPAAGADVTSPLQALADAAAQRLQTADPVAASKFR